jgi:hypothetical protein
LASHRREVEQLQDYRVVARAIRERARVFAASPPDVFND